MKGSTIFIILLLIFLVAAGAWFFWDFENIPQTIAPTQQTSAQQPALSQQTSAQDTIKITGNSSRQYLVDYNGMSLYHFTKDTAVKSNCTGVCAAVWPAFYTDNLVVSSPLASTNFSTIIISDGTEQLAYKGQPLYYYSKDSRPGDILGNGLNGLWFLVNP